MEESATAITLDQERQFVLAAFEGRLDYVRVLASFEEIVNSPDYSQGRSCEIAI